MFLQSELPCWEIIQCNRKQKCLLAGDVEKACWEMVEDDEACSFHICVDCLVYLVKQKDSPLSEEDFSSILKQRKVEGIREYKCSLAHGLR
ncbi:MAG: hypothetical protein KJ990_04310 [Proteobacteria bacterium]|nr:hypothetical protein [Pseudomonadota bacterium]MBU1649921.1 hypothetical protein [Pseudomonadota bacterium]